MVLDRGLVSFCCMWLSSFHNLLDRFYFANCVFWLPCQTLPAHILRDYFLALICAPQASMSIFVLVPYCLITVVWQFEIRRCDASRFVPVHYCFGQQGSLGISHTIQGSSFYFCEKVYWNFDRDCFDSVDSFWLYGHFNNINSFDIFVCAFFNFFIKVLSLSQYRLFISLVKYIPSSSKHVFSFLLLLKG